MKGLILANGRFYTMDPGRPRAEAAGLRDGRIVSVGSIGEVREAMGSPANVIDLEGRTVLPGLIDSHTHLSFLGLKLKRVDLEGIADLGQAAERVGRAAEKAASGTWILGSGWNKNLWGRWPEAADLDAIAPENPVALDSKDYHSLWVNTAALRLAGIGPETQDPAGGQILRHPHTGRPSGVLMDAARVLVARVIPPPSRAELEAAIAGATALAQALGVTGVHVPEGAEVFRVFQDLERAGKLGLRVLMMLPGERLDEAVEVGLRTGFGNEWLRVGPLKLFSDGALGSQTAWMLDPYDGMPGYTGLAIHEPGEIRELASRAVEGGLSLAIHAIGDRANREVLDALEAVRTVSAARGLRHRIEHAQILHPADIPRFAQLDVIASVQPIHATSDRYTADRYWGERARHAYPFRSLLSTGARLAFGSDAPVETIDPLKGIYAAVARKRQEEPDSEPWYPEERLSVEEAVHAYTLGAAYASGEERIKGSIAPGKVADLTVLSRDIFAVSSEELSEARVLGTILGGDLVYWKLD
ncbi:MAG: amidohydrolase [Actinobacteria bacterium]|nr:amidohydrolase [Actinomycetota bacterium]